MFKNSEKKPAVGSTVKADYMSLTVKAVVPTLGHSAPDVYILSDAKGSQLYKCVPHSGVEKITPLEARRILVYAYEAIDREAQRLAAQSRQALADIAEINDLVFA